MASSTLSELKKIIQKCKVLFIQKHKDYGTTWRTFRLSTFTDLILIKAKRIRTIQVTGKQLVKDTIYEDLTGIINYAIMALMQITLNNDSSKHLSLEEVSQLYDKCISSIIALQQKKNHDYGEAWKEMRQSSIIDLILAKILRIQHIENAGGKVTYSEGIEPNYQDIVNYASFCIIKLEFSKKKQ